MMLYLLYYSIIAALVCVGVLGLLKYLYFVGISKMRIDSRDQKKKPKLTTTEVLTLLRNLKPFPISFHAGWKLHSVLNCSRVWVQEVSIDSQSAGFNIFASFRKVRVPAQTLLHILKDVSKTSSWKPGCLATSITSKPLDDDTGSRLKGMMGSLPVQHDIVIEEVSLFTDGPQSIWNSLFFHDGDLATLTKEHRRYWHREDNGVCWHVQMSEEQQEWLFFLAQPVEDVDSCLLTVIGYQGSSNSAAQFVSDTLGSLADYIHYRKLVTTPLLDMKQPTSKSERIIRSYSSSEDQNQGKGMFLRFRSLVEKPTFGAEKLYSVKQQLLRSTSILRHKSPTFTNGFDHLKSSNVPDSLKTSSLDRRKNMPKLQTTKTVQLDIGHNTESSSRKSTSESNKVETCAPVTDKPNTSHKDNNNVAKASEQSDVVSKEQDDMLKTDPSDSESDDVDSGSRGKDIDRTLDADVNAQEQYEQSNKGSLSSPENKEDIQQLVTANHMAAELLTVALQASNIDLSKSVQEQVINSGGWMFCGLDNDVVVLKKVSIRENIHCYLGKGVIQAAPATVWNAIRNPRTKFTYDDSLKKVDVLEKLSDSIKIVYYYHEVLQLFKTESYDMIVTQSERVDKGDKYVLAMQSADRAGVALPESTQRVMMLPSGWIIEPLQKDKKIYSMVTYIMQIDHGDVALGSDRSPFEDFIAKQPMSIAYLRQYLKGSVFPK